MIVFEKIIVHPIIGEIKYTKNSSNKNIRLTLHHRNGILVTLPWYVSFSKAQSFVESNIDWIKKSIERERRRRSIAQQSGKIIEIPHDTKQINKIRKEAREMLVPRLYELSAKHGFIFNKVALKNNVSNWGSCSSRNNINLNIRLIYLPQELIDYVILHELCHLKHHNHGEEFHFLLNSILNNQEKRLSKELRSYSPR